ncbi:DUF6531 domain-containing protein [Hydrogenophaga sp.]|uniref:DUF6531 domain-containing protein n=1 Tax=Hydrogenophaga sp. TaxID=1904254 RepID=UPI002FCC980F
MVMWMWLAMAAQVHASASTVCSQSGTWCEPASVAYSNGWYSNSPRYATADEVCRSYNMQSCRAGVDPVYGRGCYCTVEGREHMYQNWYVAHRPSQACPTRLPNYTDDGWSVEVVNPVCYGPTTIAPEEQSCGVGNPTLPGTGTKVHSETDYAPSFSHPIPFERHYRSKHSVSAIQTANGWLHSYSARLYQPALSTSAYALRPNGEIVRFNKDATTATWKSESGDLQLAEQLNASGVLTGWRLTQRSDNTSELFDKKGQLTHVEARNGWRLTLGYNANGQPESVTNHFGRRLTLAYDSAGRLISMTTPGGDITRYGHDAQGNLLTVTWPDGNIKRYHYEDSRFPRALTGITDESGQRIGSYTYDAQGRVSETQRASGVDRVQFSYGTDATGLPQTQITDFSSGTPTTRTYNFVQQGRVLRPSGVSSPCPLCGSTARSTQYDAAGRKTREISHDGSVIFYTYNAAGQETERATFPASFSSATTRPALSNATSVVSTMWDGTSNLPFRIAEPGRSTTYSYSNQALAATSTYATTDTTGALKFNGTPTGPTSSTQYAYNANKLNTSITELTNGVQTQRWNLAYDALGDLTSITDVTAGNQSATLTNDAQGRLTRVNASNGAVASFNANSRGQMTAAYTPGGNVTYTYDARNLINEIRFSDGRWVRYSYNTAQKLIEIRDSSGLIEQIAATEIDGLNPKRLMQRVAQWLDDRGDRITRMLVSEARANPVVVLVPAGVVLGLMTLAEANRLNATSSQGVGASACGAACQGGAGKSGGTSATVPSVAAIGWLTQVGVILSGQTQTSSTPTAPVYDKAGLLVSPQACVSGTGNCDPNKHGDLQDEVNQSCKGQARSCSSGQTRSELLLRLDRNRSCAVARDKINKICFAGGDLVHRNQAIDAWTAVTRCEDFLSRTP